MNHTTRRSFLKTIGAAGSALAAGAALPTFAQSATADKKTPNVVVIFTDDQGYNDLGCFGSPNILTPNIDRMASEGVKFTNFHVAQAVCGASRAALLTGCYPNRIGLLGAPGPNARHGVAKTEMTIADLVKQKDYATAMFGKWHLGHRKPFLPTRHGFDEYFGLPYSNDMWPKHPTNPKAYPPLPLIEGEEVIETNPDQSQLTTWYTERAVNFIEKNKERPFFLYVAHNMPHVPLFVSDKFKGKSRRGLYGDVIMEIDWSVGRIIETLKKNGLDDNTLVIFTSDNGPWLSYGERSGLTGGLREGKGTSWEGGTRVPCVMRWPGKIPAASVCQETAMTIDLLPTIAHLTGTKTADHIIDGKNIWPLMSGQEGAKSPQEAYYTYWGNHLDCVMAGDWKLHFPHTYRTMEGRPGGRDGQPKRYGQGKTEFELYHLGLDVVEIDNRIKAHPEVFERLKALGEKFDAHIKATRREPGRV